MSPDAACVAALAGFTRMTTSRLTALLSQRDATTAFAVATGAAPPPPPIAAVFRRDPELVDAWRDDGARRTPARVAEQCADAGIDVVLPTDERFPPQLHDDPRRPAVLFVRGDLDALDARRVGVVGTRNATHHGREVAAEYGHELATAGVTVLSGLAKGIDGAAHRGALAVEGSRPVGIVGNGLDRAYPAQHRRLWDEVAERGALVSEWPPGTPPDAFRFPLRNRILAALVEVLVVVESRERGGSLITAREAAERGVDVFAVPGSVTSRASLGTNQLLRDGASPALEVSDVLVALGLDGRRAGRARFDARPRPSAADAVLVDECRGGPLTLDLLAARVGRDLADTALAVARLERAGWVRETAGWFESVDVWADLADGAR